MKLAVPTWAHRPAARFGPILAVPTTLPSSSGDDACAGGGSSHSRAISSSVIISGYA